MQCAPPYVECSVAARALQSWEASASGAQCLVSAAAALADTDATSAQVRAA